MTVRPGRVPAADYARFKEYYSALVKTANQKIAVRKAP